MKKSIRLDELEKYCEAYRPKRIIYITENQDCYSVENPCRLNIAFTDIYFFTCPNTVYLKGRDNVMQFDRVVLVEIDTERTVLGTVITLLCGEKIDNKYQHTYVLILQP